MRGRLRKDPVSGRSTRGARAQPHPGPPARVCWPGRPGPTGSPPSRLSSPSTARRAASRSWSPSRRLGCGIGGSPATTLAAADAAAAAAAAAALSFLPPAPKRRGNGMEPVPPELIPSETLPPPQLCGCTARPQSRRNVGLSACPRLKSPIASRVRISFWRLAFQPYEDALVRFNSATTARFQ